MKSLYKILAKESQKSRKYFQNCIFYAKEIKKTIKELYKDAKVLVFGSAIRQKYHPDSDIDILIISSKIPQDLFKQAEIKIKIKEKFSDAPFELHLATPQEYETWYKKFIKKDYIEV